MKKLSFLICLLILVAFNSKAQVPGSGSRRTFFTTASTTNTFTVPAGVTMLYFEACSAGGGRGGRFMNTAADYKWGGGGGGGGFVRGYINVTAGQILTATVGAGGANGSDGSPTSTPAIRGKTLRLTWQAQ